MSSSVRLSFPYSSLAVSPGQASRSEHKPAEALHRESVLLARPTNASTDPLILRVRYISEFDEVTLEFKLLPQSEDNEVQRLLTALRAQHNRLMELEKQVYESGLSVRQKTQRTVQRMHNAFKKLVKNDLAPVQRYKLNVDCKQCMCSVVIIT